MERQPWLATEKARPGARSGWRGGVCRLYRTDTHGRDWAEQVAAKIHRRASFSFHVEIDFVWLCVCAFFAFFPSDLRKASNSFSRSALLGMPFCLPHCTVQFSMASPSLLTADC